MPSNRRQTKIGPQIVDLLVETPASEHASVRLEPEPAEVEATRPAPESQLTQEQRRIRELENQLALERGKKEPEVELDVPANPGDGSNIVIHFLEDGFTALGQTWVRGQELEFEPDSQAYRDTCDRHGRSWLELRNNEFEQVDRWGVIMFRNGPWPGKPLTAAAEVPFEPVRGSDGSIVRPPSVEELEAAAAAEAKRRRAAPRLPAR